MKIDKNSPLRPVQVSTLAPSRTGAEPTAQGTSATTDSVELSGWKDEVASLRERIKPIPAVDEDKVARVKQAIDSGTYAPDSKKVARSILKGQLLDDLA
jgi:negative regulator of flagellin synthesis FlgM